MLRLFLLSTKTLGLWLACLLVTAPANASFIGQTLDFEFTESGYLPETKNGVVVVDPGFELAFGDLSDIADNIMFDGEFIDVGIDTITFSIRGDGPDYGVAGYQTTGFGADATYTISGFDTDFLSLFEVPALDFIGMEVDNILGVSLGTELIIGADFISLTIGTLGVGEVLGGLDVGTITLRAVPVPAALPLLLTGLFALGLVSRRRQRLQ